MTCVIRGLKALPAKTNKSMEKHAKIKKQKKLELH